MTSPKDLGRTPRARILELAELIGEAEVALWCAGLLARSIRFNDPQRPHLTWLGGRHAAALLHMDADRLTRHEYWPRVWGARGLMYVWRDDARSAVISGLRDPAWRVREMSAKVVRSRGLAEAEAVLARLAYDPIERVRQAAERALAELAERL